MISSKKKIIACLMMILFIQTTKAALISRRTRRWGVRPINSRRNDKGHFNNLLEIMRCEDNEQFAKYTRLSTKEFDNLLKLVRENLTKSKHNALPPAFRLIITLHYLAEGCSQQEIAWNFYIGKSTASNIIHETCIVIFEKLQPTYLKPPTKSSLLEVSEKFLRLWNVPNCVGALDGKHVSIQAPNNSGSNYFNFKKGFSLVLMAACDAEYNFIYVDIGAVGSNHDSTVFKNSTFGHGIINNISDIVELPQPRKLPGSDITLPYFLVADQAFPLHENIMRPFPGRNLPERKLIFNYRISRARRVIENAFGILVQRWRIFRKPMLGKIENIENIVKCAVVLHNFVRAHDNSGRTRRRLFDEEDEEGNILTGSWRDEVKPLKSIGRIGSNNSKKTIIQNREKLADYFLTEYGEVPWQVQMVHGGSSK